MRIRGPPSGVGAEGTASGHAGGCIILAGHALAHLPTAGLPLACPPLERKKEPTRGQPEPVPPIWAAFILRMANHNWLT